MDLASLLEYVTILSMLIFSCKGEIKDTVLFKKGNSAVHMTLTTIVMTCLVEFEEIILDETAIEVATTDMGSYSIQISLSIKYTSRVIRLCEDLQWKVIAEVEAMTGIKVDHVNITVQKVINEKNA